MLLFDLDNTLFPFRQYWEEANRTTFTSSPLTNGLSYDAFLPLLKMFDEELWPLHVKEAITLNELRVERFIRTMHALGRSVNKEQSQHYFEAFMENLLSSITMDEELRDFLDKLQQSYTLAILTNGKEKEQWRKIIQLNLTSVIPFEHIFISEDIGYDKPDPRAFQHVLKTLNVEARSATYIGDSWTHDIQGSIGVGMNAIWITPRQASSINENLHLSRTIYDIEPCLFHLNRTTTIT
ncbi:hydrolase [Pontibacillus halophilus JSM 076056 = DSM 19796]|uniref:Hydrolase n=1 Tax=Pontibacillus halophilus JSM 076056 = DSM 19796 TaxID=1385510 RepID=A0A0A5GJ04_9BACI|nr:hydrolase [Pontibacillus halophilus JSM 076056 = DSM 19796]